MAYVLRIVHPDEGDSMSEIDAIKFQLESIAEALNDVAMSLLSDAIERGATTRPQAEKNVSQARRAVEKAIHHLGSISDD